MGDPGWQETSVHEETRCLYLVSPPSSRASKSSVSGGGAGRGYRDFEELHPSDVTPHFRPHFTDENESYGHQWMQGRLGNVVPGWVGASPETTPPL